MYKKKILGNLGEDIACKFILNKGYEIVERNFYCRQGEIDIIAKDNEFLVFIEVKTRKNENYGRPIDAITFYKKKHFINSIEYYLYKNRIKNIPIRIGVNSGSLEKHILAKYGSPTPEAMVESALYHANLLEKFDFDDIIISIKSSNVETMINAYELAAQKCDYPLHLGVTEAGTERMGIIKSAVGIGSLLTHGIGDTIRVSLTDSPVKEVFAAFDILKAIGLKNDCPYLISCPTCGRTKIDLVGLAKQVEERLKDCKKPIKVAVMGCIVNGPGEAKEADIGIAGGDGCGLIFKKGEILRKVDEKDLLDELMKEIDKL